MWLRRADRLLLGSLLVVLVILLLVYRWKLSGGWRTEIEIANQRPRPYFYAIDINRASWVEWAQLDGIGEKLARRIVKDREDRGPFASIDDVGRVRGIGPKLIEKLKPYLKSGEQRPDGPPGFGDGVKALR
jgi:competence protein ComEA